MTLSISSPRARSGSGGYSWARSRPTIARTRSGAVTPAIGRLTTLRPFRRTVTRSASSSTSRR
ncbi:hypothetical protein ACIBHY_37905 [Nonomuraea sp. NPDC050547]|uniref:hypothetical protein n=1 Tax=Nonomuraea sp. NPDC050547 TaxID=3364368 RepID=UPI00379F3F0C